MIEYLEPVSLKFIFWTAAVAAAVVIADAVILLRSNGIPRLRVLRPAVDSVLVIAGFMAFIGTGIAMIQSFNRIASARDLNEETISPLTQRLQYSFSAHGWAFMFKVEVTALMTVTVAWFLFFVFFEAWLLLRGMLRRRMKAGVQQS
jgi:hypothetical protein